MEIRQEFILGEDWMIFLLLFSLFIVAFLRFRYPRKVEQVIESIIHTRMARQRMRDDQLFASNFSILLSLNFVLMAGYFIFLLLKHLQSGLIAEYGGHLLWLVMITVILVYFIKSIVTKMGENLMDKNYGSGEYLYNVFLFNKGIGVVMLPINIGFTLISKQLAGVFIWVGLIVICVFVAIRILRGLRIALDNNARILYLILYLCALEVLPTALIVKELAGNVN